MVPAPVSFLFQQFTILKCAILATVTVVMISVHPGLLASPVEKIRYSQDQQKPSAYKSEINSVII